MAERTLKYTIANDYDPNGDISADDDPLTGYLSTFVPSNLMVVVGLTLEEFECHVSELAKRTIGNAS